VTERLKVHDWKSCVPLIRVPGVRIPPSPPLGEAQSANRSSVLVTQYPLKSWDVDC
jgi:hypothetical protein